ncbi:MAG: hypothetical protein Hens3KO_06220 [Henriciella sp.]
MKPVFSARCEFALQTSTHEILLLFSHRGVFDADHLVRTLEEEIAANLPPDEVLIALPAPVFDQAKSQLENDPTLSLFVSRLQKRSTITLVAYDATGYEAKRAHLGGETLDSEIRLHDLNRRMITAIFNKRGGFVDAKETYHFVNPSKRHTKRFIRLSNILVNAAEIGFMAYTCLHRINDEIDRLLLDTPMLHSIAASINEIRAVFGLPFLDVENFRSYGGLLEDGIESDDESLVIISASSSGGLARKLSAEFDMLPDQIVHFLYLGNNPELFHKICDLRVDKDENPHGVKELPIVYSEQDCKYCQQGSYQVHLHGDQFDVVGPQPDPILLKKADAPKNLASTMGRFIGRRALSVFLGEPERTRRRDYFISADRIVTDEAFQERADYVFRRVIPASVSHIIQVDEYSEDISKLVQKFIVRHNGSAQIVDGVDQIDIDNGSSIIVAVSAIESGRCLTDISRELRSVAQHSPIIYLVGVEKTTGFSQREALKNTLVQCPHSVKHEYVAIEQLTLPAAAMRNAWNLEYDFLKGNAETLVEPVKDFVEARIERLKQSSEPMVDDLFLPALDGEKLQIRDGFVYWPNATVLTASTQADVFFTVASVLQRLRANAETDPTRPAIRSVWYHQTVLDPANFVRFNDDVIQASLLRAAQPSELNYSDSPTESREMARIIAGIVRSADRVRGRAAPEFMLAIASGRLKLRGEDLSLVVREGLKSSGMVRAITNCVELD